MFIFDLNKSYILESEALFNPEIADYSIFKSITDKLLKPIPDTPDICKELSDFINDYISDLFTLYIPDDDKIKKRIANEIVRFIFLQLLYEINKIQNNDKFISFDDLLWYSSKNDIMHDSKITYSNNRYKESEQIINKIEIFLPNAKRENYVGVFKEKLKSLSHSLHLKIINHSNINHLNNFLSFYLRFLVLNADIVNYIEKSVESYAMDDVYKNYRNKLIPFADNYNELIKAVNLYFDKFNDETNENYYLFLHQLYLDTLFFDLNNISKHCSHGYLQNRMLATFDKNISPRITMSNIDDVSHFRLKYDENFDYYLNYLTDIISYRISPTLNKTLIESNGELQQIQIALNKLDCFIPDIMKVLYFSLSTNENFKNNIIKVLDYELLNNTQKDKLHSFFKTDIIGNNFQDLCFAILQKMNEQNNT